MFGYAVYMRRGQRKNPGDIRTYVVAVLLLECVYSGSLKLLRHAGSREPR
jgi:hypothetical protein